MNAFTLISGKGQVVIPKAVRDRLQLSPGDRLEVVERPDGVLLRRETRPSTESFEAITERIRSRVVYVGPPLSLEEMDRAIADMWLDGGPRWDK
jgi:AbrB family looped-hinge helix DNA binding protein